MIRLTKATPQAIKYACTNFHYAKRVPTVYNAYNVYEDDEWCGVIIFSAGATPNIGKQFGMKQGEILELVRVALNGKQNCTSECVAAAMKQLHRDNPCIKMLVSFADTEQGHAGTIYQATNWIYIGLKTQGLEHFVIFGKEMHKKSVYSKGWVQSEQWLREHVDPNARKVKESGKHKYIFCFDKTLRKKWLNEAKPYPKKGS